MKKYYFFFLIDMNIEYPLQCNLKSNINLAFKCEVSLNKVSTVKTFLIETSQKTDVHPIVDTFNFSSKNTRSNHYV